MNLGWVLLSQHLNSQTFEVFRSYGDFGEGGWVEAPTSPSSFMLQGIVLPASEKELRQLPEGDRVLGAMVFYSQEQLFVTHNGEYKGLSDQVVWRGERYKILQSMPYIDYGFYVSTGQRIVGD